jgi:hypothetical protein
LNSSTGAALRPFILVTVPLEIFSLIEHTRAYLRDFAQALKTGDPNSLEKGMWDKYPEHHARQILNGLFDSGIFPEQGDLTDRVKKTYEQTGPFR